MTEPLDLDALKATYDLGADWNGSRLLRALIDELEATRAERDELYAIGGPLYTAQNEAFDQRARAERAEATIARVKELHHQPNTEPCSDPRCCGYEDCCDECGQPVPCDMWLALRGDQ